MLIFSAVMIEPLAKPAAVFTTVTVDAADFIQVIIMFHPVIKHRGAEHHIIVRIDSAEKFFANTVFAVLVVIIGQAGINIADNLFYIIRELFVKCPDAE